ncbi:MAG: TrkA family potassium uptake protein [Clostridia bacterium]|nr:TrkA family potassium uptake protein [Clostridia bacterium]
MSVNKSYAVFGLGRYGTAVARELSNSGADVIAIDMDESVVNAASTVIPVCKCANITDPEVIKQLGIGNMDVVIIAMANCLEASIMAITLCKEAGVKTVIVKCGTEMQQRIFTRVGADKVVFPENESGTRLAKNLVSSGFVDMIDLSDEVSMIELDVMDEWVGKNLIELNLRKKYGMNIVAIRIESEVTSEIDPTAPLTSNMELIVIAKRSKLGKLVKKTGKK